MTTDFIYTKDGIRAAETDPDSVNPLHMPRFKIKVSTARFFKCGHLQDVITSNKIGAGDQAECFHCRTFRIIQEITGIRTEYVSPDNN